MNPAMPHDGFTAANAAPVRGAVLALVVIGPLAAILHGDAGR
jgi:hypothetical protein